MIIQQRFFEHLCFYVVVLFLLSPCKKLVWGVTSVVGDGTTMKRGCMENEREALLQFRQGLIADNGFLSSWGSEDDKRDCCKWRGVKCSNRTGHVITLNLSNQVGRFELLRGKISPSLLELKHLKHLDLSNNDFGVSRIPEFIGSLSRLRYLNLQNSNFFGTIPHQLGNLTNLRAVYLGGYSQVLSVRNLEWLSDLRLLGKLYLLSVDLGKIDWLQSIDRLSFLSELHLVGCELPGIISPSYHLTNSSSIPLSIIDLSYNNFLFSSVSNWLFNFSSSLVDIDMHFNPLRGSIPDAFGNMMSLKHLNLGSSSLEGEIPISFRNLSSLRSLNLSESNLTGQLPQLFRMLIASKNSLEILDLRSNKVSGSLPDFTIFSSLRELRLGTNKLEGSFPKSFGRSSPLVYLDLSDNELNGSFPDLTSFPLLRYLTVRNNKLKGRVPESIGQLSNLRELCLSFNSLILEFSSDWNPRFQLDVIKLPNSKLGPEFPEWLKSQKNFCVLDISSAGILNPIPYWFWDLSPRLQYLNISYNQIHGTLPDLSLKFVNFPTIDLRSNHFKGPIPLLPPNVSTLNLSKNMFSGSIISLCSIATEFLYSLDLSDNRLSGEVPDCWIRANKLGILDLANNNFFGEIPTSFGFLDQLQLLSLHNNDFEGEFPSSLKNCTTLVVMDVSENKLSGQVPAWIGTHLRGLVVLSFRRNEFRGSIPPSICHLNRTQVLDLSRNKISGNIPQCFNKLYSLIQTESSRAIMSLGLSAPIYNGSIDYYGGNYMAGALVQWKGKLSEYRKTLGLLKCIDLSSNKLVGKIPQELASLEGLGSLNLSRNILTGNVTKKIGQMERLEVLDLSRNQLSGEIPTSLASLTFLSMLDLSSNNFSGKIPSGTQLQSFDASVYAGNRQLCGLPLPNKCPGEDESASVPPFTDHRRDKANDEDEETFVTSGFYASVVLGFAVGFWVFFGPLMLRRSWRYAYFQFLERIKDWICVIITINMARLQRKVRG